MISTNNEVELKIIQDEESYSYSPICGKAVMIDPSQTHKHTQTDAGENNHCFAQHYYHAGNIRSNITEM